MHLSLEHLLYIALQLDLNDLLIFLKISKFELFNYVTEQPINRNSLFTHSFIEIFLLLCKVSKKSCL